VAGNTETAVLAGGCFWIMQQLLRDRDGVISTRVGWIGGENENPTEEDNSGHAEAVEVTYDPSGSLFVSCSSGSSRSIDPTSTRMSSAPATARKSSVRRASSER
jgi:peptide-methionine (S)-S-oxide reductase